MRHNKGLNRGDGFGRAIIEAAWGAPSEVDDVSWWNAVLRIGSRWEPFQVAEAELRPVLLPTLTALPAKFRPADPTT